MDTPDTEEQLRERIQAKEAAVGVVGLGYTGLPLCALLHAGGLRVVGFDRDPQRVRALQEGRSYLGHVDVQEVAVLAGSDRFDPSDDLAGLAELDAIVVCLPTPLDPAGEPDLSYVREAAREIGQRLRAGQLVVLESTSYPGTTRDVFHAAIREAQGPANTLRCGEDYFVAYSPERLDPGRRSPPPRSVPKLVGGLDPASTRSAVALYECAFDHVVATSCAEVAEASKLLENVFRAVNIALVNELKGILAAMEIDVWEVIAAAATKPFGYMPFHPGPGLGGHCIPIDPFYLAWKARAVGQPTRFVELAGEINTAMPLRVVDAAVAALEEQGRSIRDARVLVLGVAYKPDLDDTRGSPGIRILEELLARGARAAYSDPHVPTIELSRPEALRLESQAIGPATLAALDCVIVAADHEAVDWPCVGAHAGLIVDTRDALRRRRVAVRGRSVLA